MTAARSDLAQGYRSLEGLLSEGADEVHTLVMGRSLTGIAAFAGAS